MYCDCDVPRSHKRSVDVIGSVQFRLLIPLVYIKTVNVKEYYLLCHFYFRSRPNPKNVTIGGRWWQLVHAVCGSDSFGFCC